MRLVEVNKRSRYPFIGVFKGYTTTGGQRGVAIHINFENVINEYGQLVANYVSFANIKTFSSLYLKPGDVVLFWARIRDFTKVLPNYKYNGSCEMYSRLLNPTKARKLYCPVRRIGYPEFNENNFINYKRYNNTIPNNNYATIRVKVKR